VLRKEKKGGGKKRSWRISIDRHEEEGKGMGRERGICLRGRGKEKEKSDRRHSLWISGMEGEGEKRGKRFYSLYYRLGVEERREGPSLFVCAQK